MRLTILFSFFFVKGILMAQDTLDYQILNSSGLVKIDVNKLIQIDYYFSESSPKCNQLKNTLFKSRTVIDKLNKDFQITFVNNDLEENFGPKIKYIKYIYGVYTVPGFYFYWIRKDGRMKKIRTINGLVSEEKFLKILDICISRVNKIPKSEFHNSLIYDLQKSKKDSDTSNSSNSIKIISNPDNYSLSYLSSICEKQNILIYFSTQGCSPCKRFEEDLKNQDFIQSLKDFSIVKFDDTNQAGINGIKAFKIKTFPTFIVFKPKVNDAKKYVKWDWFGYSNSKSGRESFLGKILKKR